MKNFNLQFGTSGFLKNFFFFHPSSDIVILLRLQATMADEDISLNEDQLLDNLDDANGDLLNEVNSFNVKHQTFRNKIENFRRNLACKSIQSWKL